MQGRLVIVDLDGTLLDDRHCVDETVRRVVATVRERGALFSIATGRIFASARRVALEAGVDCAIIAGGGAIIGTPGGAVLDRLALGTEAARAVLRMVGRDHCRYLFVNDSILTDTPGEHVEKYSRALGVPVTVVENLNSHVSGGDATHIVLRMSPEEAARAVKEYSAASRGIARVMRTLPHLVEFVNPLVSKGNALKTLCRMLSVSTGDVVAVGDSESDMDMLQVAGAGVLVSNARPELKERVRYVTRNPHAAGVMEAVERFLPPRDVSLLCRSTADV
ncbi:MAG: HAD family hydrolase [Ignavibacteriales bacterium]